MTQNAPSLLERSSRLWRLDELPPDKTNEGPVALLRSLCMLALRHKMKLILCTAVGVGLAAAYAHSLPRTYTATATVLLEPRHLTLTSSQDSQNLDLNRADGELQIIRSERLLSAVFNSLDLGDNPELGPQPPSISKFVIGNVMDAVNYIWSVIRKPDTGKAPRPDPASGARASASVGDANQAAFSNFTQHLDARRVGQSYVIEISYSSSDPTLAARIANATVSAYILQAVSFKDEMARAGTEVLQWRLDALAAQVAAATDAMKQGALPAIPTPDGDARIIGAALVPLSPSGPRATLITVLGGILGVLFGFSIIVLSIAFDRKVRNVKDLARDTGVPCLGSLPDPAGRASTLRGTYSRKSSVVVNQPGSAYAMAIHNLRTSIEIACSTIRNERGLIIAITGWEPGQGISKMGVSLAQFLSRSGRHVTLFYDEAGQHNHSNRESDDLLMTSLADALVDDMRPEQILLSNGRNDGQGIARFPIHSTNALTNLYVDFRDRRAGRIVEAARARGDVLLALPPVGASSDAVALSVHADAVIVVACAGRTTTDQVNDALLQLRRAGANVIGTVIDLAKA
jgi:capsular polysaccharide biosynthesis protein